VAAILEVPLKLSVPAAQMHLSRAGVVAGPSRAGPCPSGAIAPARSWTGGWTRSAAAWPGRARLPARRQPGGPGRRQEGAAV